MKLVLIGVVTGILFLAGTLTAADDTASQRPGKQPKIEADTADLPDSPVGNRVRALLDTIRKNDPEATRAFVRTHLDQEFQNFAPMEAHLEAFSRMHQDLGDFRIDDVLIDDGMMELILVSGATGDRFKLMVEMEPRSQLIASIGMDPYDEMPESAPTFRNFGDVEAYLQELADDDRFSGAVLIAQKDRPVFQKAYGWANQSKKVPNTMETRFNVGSITKLFTAVAVLQLVEKGKLRLDDTIGKYLPDFPAEAANRVTIRHLLRMESGYGDYLMSPEYQEKRTDLKNVSDLLGVIRKLPLEFEPGTGRRYSNAGYAILGGIIEKASGKDYYEYISENVFGLAKMTASGFPKHAEAGSDIAIGYTAGEPEDSGEPHETNLRLFAVRGSPAGGSYSSAEDLLRFDIALRNHRLLNARNTALLLNFFDESKTELPPGMGFAGGAPGISAVTIANYESGLNVIVLSNYDEPSAEMVGKALRSGVESISGAD